MGDVDIRLGFRLGGPLPGGLRGDPGGEQKRGDEVSIGAGCCDVFRGQPIHQLLAMSTNRA
ncbi:hypothetical protein PL81_31160 [Streptomyces sp. RSD-27]|nr:hypothetical protein PL81_31160 [Streptomyces sp. RSD-27]